VFVLDKVQFGEVVLEPPTLSAKPRHSANTPASQVSIPLYCLWSYWIGFWCHLVYLFRPTSVVRWRQCAVSVCLGM